MSPSRRQMLVAGVGGAAALLAGGSHVLRAQDAPTEAESDPQAEPTSRLPTVLLALASVAPPREVLDQFVGQSPIEVGLRAEVISSPADFFARLSSSEPQLAWGPASLAAFAPEFTTNIILQEQRAGDFLATDRNGLGYALRQSAMYVHPSMPDAKVLSIENPSRDFPSRSRYSIALLEPSSVVGYLMPLMSLSQNGWGRGNLEILTLRSYEETLAALRAGVVEAAVGPVPSDASREAAMRLEFVHKFPPAPTPAIFLVGGGADALRLTESYRRALTFAGERVLKPHGIQLRRCADAPYDKLVHDARVWYERDPNLSFWRSSAQ